MKQELPPVVKQAERLMIDVERAVARFPVSFKHGFGADLRANAFDVSFLAHCAWRERNTGGSSLEKLCTALDVLKLRLSHGMKLNAFASKAQYAVFAELANGIGRQIGGWKKQQHLKRQNPAPAASTSERPSILSRRDTSSEVNV